MVRACKKCFRGIPRRKKRSLRKKLGLRRPWKQFAYSITEEKPIVPGRPYKFSASLLKLRKCVTFFYGIRKSRASLRKLFFHQRTRAFRQVNNSKKFGNYLEKRIDVLLYRCSLVESILQSRHFIRKKQVSLITYGKNNKKFSTIGIKESHFQVPLFNFFKLAPVRLLNVKLDFVMPSF